MSNRSQCSTVLSVLTDELRESVGFKKEFRTLSTTVQKRVLLLNYLLFAIYKSVLSVLPFSTFRICPEREYVLSAHVTLANPLRT
jgi:hypothetical protein